MTIKNIVGYLSIRARYNSIILTSPVQSVIFRLRKKYQGDFNVKKDANGVTHLMFNGLCVYSSDGVCKDDSLAYCPDGKGGYDATAVDMLFDEVRDSRHKPVVKEAT